MTPWERFVRQPSRTAVALANTVKAIATHPLNRRNKLRSLVGFLRWQVGSRLVPGPVVFDWLDGARFFVGPGQTGLTGNIYSGLQEFNDMGFLLHYTRADDVFVDVGANLGSYTLLACGVVGARGYAFEPIPETHQRLVSNLRLNSIEHLVVHPNVGIGDKPGMLHFTRQLDTVNHVLATEETCNDTVAVKVATLDELLGTDAPTVMKIDVEGYETAVLRGAQKALACSSLNCIIMELNGSGARYGYDDDDLVKMLSGYGFAAVAYDPVSRHVRRLSSKNLATGNTIFVRDMALVLQRVSTAPRVRVHSASI